MRNRLLHAMLRTCFLQSMESAQYKRQVRIATQRTSAVGLVGTSNCSLSIKASHRSAAADCSV